MTRIAWPPKVIEGSEARFSLDGSLVHAKLDGQPSILLLQRLHENDKSIRGEALAECCDCGLIHLLTYEVIYVREEFHLLKRAHRIKDGRKPSKVRARTGTRKK